MFWYNENKYNGVTYKYDLDEYDMMNDPMFDASIHDNTIEIMPSEREEDRYTCAYCKTQFESRNKLFYHLGFMNIDIRPQQIDMTNETKPKRVKRRQNYWWKVVKNEKRKKRYYNKRQKKQSTVADLISLVSSIQLL